MSDRPAAAPQSRDWEDPELPQSAEFFEVFRGVLNRWAYLDCAAEGSGLPLAQSGLDLERSLLIAGERTQGLLVLRSEAAFGGILAEAASGEQADEQGAQDAFTELCNQYGSHVMSGLWEAEQERFRPFLPRQSGPESWPTRPADRCCSLRVEGYPLEIRYWSLAR